MADAFRAAAEASERVNAELARRAEAEQAELADALSAGESSIDQALDSIFRDAREAQEEGRSAAEQDAREQLGGQAQEAVEDALARDLAALRAAVEAAFPEPEPDGAAAGAEGGEGDGDTGGDPPPPLPAAGTPPPPATGVDWTGGTGADTTHEFTQLADTLQGGGGADTLDGQGGSDRYVFAAGEAPGAGATYTDTGADPGEVDVFEVQNADVDFTAVADADDIDGIEKLEMKGPAAHAQFKAAHFIKFGGVEFDNAAQTVTVEVTGTAAQDFSGVDVTGPGRVVFMGDNAKNTVTGTAGADKFVLSLGGDIIDLGDNDGAADTVKISSFGDFRGVVRNFQTAFDKIVLDPVGAKLKRGSTEVSSDANTFFRTQTDHSTSSGNGASLSSPTIGGHVVIFEFIKHDTNPNLSMTLTGATANNAVSKALAKIQDTGSFNPTKIKVKTDAGEGSSKHIFIFYNSSGADADAFVFYFEDKNSGPPADPGGGVNANELTLLAVLEGVGHGKLSASNFAFGSDPLIFDLDGDGAVLSAGPAVFDTDGDGEGEGTAWFDSGDAMLVIDENKNGLIDGMKEVVSSYLTYGGGKAAGKSSLDALAAFDGNADGVIDESDAVWSVLKLWKDDGDGVTQEGELLSLKDFGIAKISLSGEDVNEETAAGTVHRKAEAEKENGEKITVAEVSFDPADAPQDPDLPPPE